MRLLLAAFSNWRALSTLRREARSRRAPSSCSSRRCWYWHSAVNWLRKNPDNAWSCRPGLLKLPLHSRVIGRVLGVHVRLTRQLGQPRFTQFGVGTQRNRHRRREVQVSGSRLEPWHASTRLSAMHSDVSNRPAALNKAHPPTRRITARSPALTARQAQGHRKQCDHWQAPRPDPPNEWFPVGGRQ